MAVTASMRRDGTGPGRDRSVADATPLPFPRHYDTNTRYLSRALAILSLGYLVAFTSARPQSIVGRAGDVITVSIFLCFFFFCFFFFS